VYEPDDKGLTAADAALEEFDPLTENEVKVLRGKKKPSESDKGFDPELEALKEEEAVRDAEVLDSFEKPWPTIRQELEGSRLKE
jgi:hypothetical protein